MGPGWHMDMEYIKNSSCGLNQPFKTAAEPEAKLPKKKPWPSLREVKVDCSWKMYFLLLHGCTSGSLGAISVPELREHLGWRVVDPSWILVRLKFMNFISLRVLFSLTQLTLLKPSVKMEDSFWAGMTEIQDLIILPCKAPRVVLIKSYPIDQ